eukprot:Anaeramoba_flamelloidesa1077610_8.p1 GENE.a1077610_8~~a1077610_8.p1  ORF type:complete len:105 (+),score=13.95 a1077610_8:38-316(+)
MAEKSEMVVDFNQQDLNGDTILHLFCRYQIVNIDTFHFLLKCGCNPTLSNKGGRTPMDLYLKKKNSSGVFKEVIHLHRLLQIIWIFPYNSII